MPGLQIAPARKVTAPTFPVPTKVAPLDTVIAVLRVLPAKAPQAPAVTDVVPVYVFVPENNTVPLLLLTMFTFLLPGLITS
jgi:hypothetical protein